MHPDWPMYLRILLTLHIACGVTAFVWAPVALATAKGGKAHRRWGKVYFWAMAGVAVSALIFFLAMVAVFSFYASFAAYRILYLKDLYTGGKPLLTDWVAAAATMASSFLLLLMGFLRPALMGVGVVHLAGRQVSIVSVVFGLIGMRLGFSSISDFVKPPTTKMFWWFAHLQGMIGSYIAAMTAFSAVNLGPYFGTAWWVWLWPTMIGVPAISICTAYYQKKFTPRTKAVSA
jgi:hypothetical protein